MSNIAIIIPYGIYGGAEVYIENILKNKPQNLSISLLYLNDNKILHNIKNYNGITNKKFQKSEEFIKDIVSSNYQYIVYYNRLDIYNTLISLKKTGRIRSKLVEIYHSDFLWPGSLSSIKYREQLYKLITIAPSLANDISGIEGKKEIVPVGIDFSRFKDEKNKLLKAELGVSGTIIGTVARLSKEKNIDALVNLASKMKDINFIVLGDGPERENLESLILSKDLKNFKLLGHINNPEIFYSIFDAFILLSRMEGTPISILEAMACGVPVFSNGVGAIKDIIKHNKTGYILQGNMDSYPSEIRESLSKSEDIISSAKEYVKENHDIILNSQKFFNILTKGE